jgi:hypothetical protein
LPTLGVPSDAPHVRAKETSPEHLANRVPAAEPAILEKRARQ